MGGKTPALNDYWESEQKIKGVKEPILVLITAGIEGPSIEQVIFFKKCIEDLDQLFEKCWPIFEPDFEQWTEVKFNGNWKEHFDLMSIEIPRDADPKNNWSVCYFVDKANHYFTAQFENGVPKFNEIDG
ncbi:MAG: hypothetical protein HKP42_07505 [Maribacter sp.]|nr:hypothetical protein [Maribacter sp.]